LRRFGLIHEPAPATPATPALADNGAFPAARADARDPHTPEFHAGEDLPCGWRVLDVKRGGMGRVYISVQKEPTESYRAVKQPLIQSGRKGEKVRQHFRDEVAKWIQMCESPKGRHHNVVQAIQYDADAQLLFLEYVHGLPISQLMSEDVVVHPHHATQWAAGIAEGMRVLQDDFQLIHRDLKPGNILISSDGLVAKITDLGISKVLQDGQEAHSLCGTYGYIAPETFQGATHRRSDIFSFGCVLYQMLTGKPAFAETHPMKGKRPAAPSKTLSEINAGISSSVDELVLRCLEYDPDDRYNSFAEIIEHLNGIDDLATLAQSDAFRHCEIHQFHSPVGDNFPDCLFCEQQARFDRLLRDLGNAPATPRRQQPSTPPPIERVEASSLGSADSGSEIRVSSLGKLVAAVLLLAGLVWFWVPNGNSDGDKPRVSNNPGAVTNGQSEGGKGSAGESGSEGSHEAAPANGDGVICHVDNCRKRAISKGPFRNSDIFREGNVSDWPENQRPC
jgi:serine/threonine protein kinase